MKIKIWNDNVHGCSVCKYAQFDGCDNVFCCLNDKNIESDYYENVSTINKDCPFLVLPTKELIEGLGLDYVETDNNSLVFCHAVNLDNESIYAFITYNLVSRVLEINRDGFTLIQNFPISNFEHLKFILSGFGII